MIRLTTPITSTSLDDIYLHSAVGEIVDTRMDALLIKMSQMMDQKLDKVYTELRHLESHLDPSLPELLMDSYKHFPDNCCPLPRTVSVKKYLLNKPANEDADEEDGVYMQLQKVLANHPGDNLTVDLLRRLITYHISGMRIMDNIIDTFLETTDDPRVKEVFKHHCLSGSSTDEQMSTESLIKLADALGLKEIPLKPYSLYERDLEFNISFNLLMKYNKDRNHIFNHLQNLLEALHDSPTSALHKGACLNFMLPPAFIRWWSPVFPSEKLDTLVRCIDRSVSKEVAQASVDDVIHHITLFIDTYKENPKFDQDFSTVKSWAPNRQVIDGLNLIWQEY